MSFEEHAVKGQICEPTVLLPKLTRLNVVSVFIILKIFFTKYGVLKIWEISSTSWGKSCAMFKPIAQEQKYLMDYKL